MTIQRRYWLSEIERLWKERTIIWLKGVRRSGKTCLCHSIPNVEYFDCELPRVRQLIKDPQLFLEGLKGKRVVLDEIHRLDQPSELLKIAADYYPNCRIIATGSSTLGASTKFKDTLTGRKRELWLSPMVTNDLIDFQNTDLNKRLFLGGLPGFFLKKTFPEQDFQEWLDSYWAKDIQELFRVQKKDSFQKFLELLFLQTGGVFEATRFATVCEVNRATIMSYLNLLSLTYVVHIIRPFSSHKSAEIVSAPKIYGFDTGFVCYLKGWTSLRPEDKGLLWEHFVLNELLAKTQQENIHYWRNKQGAEIDFIIPKRDGAIIAIEAKWTAADSSLKNQAAFLRHYPKAKIYVVGADIDRSYTRKLGKNLINYVSLNDLIKVV